MSTSEQIPDYKLAAEELQKLFGSLNLQVSISEPFGAVEDDWPCIRYTITINRQAFDYRMGIGHVDWKLALRTMESQSFSRYPRWIESFVRIQAAGGVISQACKTDLAKAAAEVAKVQKVKPNPAEVLASVCRDGLEAESQLFEEWASEFGCDADSRKAEQIYHACRKCGSMAHRIVSPTIFRQLAELSNRL